MGGIKRQILFNNALSKWQLDKNKLSNKNFEVKPYKKRSYYYMYNRDKSILYYSSPNLSDYNLLGIHFFTLKTHLKKDSYYLGKYSFSKKFIDSAKILNMSFFEIESMLIKDRMKK